MATRPKRLKCTVVTKTGQKIKLDAEHSDIPAPEWEQYSQYISREIIDIDDIYVDHKHETLLSADDRTNRIRRNGKPDTNQCETQIIPTIKKYGILNEKPLPVVYRLINPISANGRKYWYRMGNVGNHRIWSFDRLDITAWIFDVYKEVTDRWASYDIGFDSNDTHGNIKALTTKDMVDAFKQMLEEGRWGKVEDLHVDTIREIIEDYLDEHTTISRQKYDGIVKQTVRNTDVKTDHTEWLVDQANVFVKVTAQSTVRGVVDGSRGTHGWVVGQGYLKEKFTYAIEKTLETGKGSHCYVHVNQPKDGLTTNEARYKQYEALEKLNEALDAAWEYKQRTGKYPLEIVGYLPQDELVPDDPKQVVSLQMVKDAHSDQLGPF